MATAEQLAHLLQEDGRGVYALLWDDKHDLVHALLLLRAVYGADRMHNHLLLADSAGVAALRALVDSRSSPELQEDEADRSSSSAGRLWVLFLPQAGTELMGPWLNGSRRPLSEPPGSLLVIRSADFAAFQRDAPDLTSFVGPRIYDASTMLSLFAPRTAQQLERQVPVELEGILKQLPGKAPTGDELKQWLVAHDPQG